MGNELEKEGGSSRGKLLVGVLLVAALVVAARFLDIQALLRSTLDWISGLGPWGPVVFAATYIIACVAFVPGSVLTLGAGLVFGLVKGSIIVSISATLGATAAFLIGRYLAREWVAGKIEGNERFKAIDEAVGREGWKIVGLTRLSPVFPFNLLNYAYGVTGVSLRDYFMASWAGMLPGTVMYVYIGSLAGDMAALGSEGGRSPEQWALYGVGFLATVAVTIYVTRLARRALTARVS